MPGNITFVTGAGANVDYGFPTGAELIPEIRAFLSRRRGNPALGDIKLIEDLDEAIDALDCTTIPYIDLFMQIRERDRDGSNDAVNTICKQGIVNTILEYENKYILRPSKQQNWLEYLIAEIAREAGHKAREFKKSRIKFITFNYDRLIEYKIREAFIKLLGISDKSEADDIVEEYAKSSIIHVYGSIGSLKEIAFGEEKTGSELNILSKNIRVIGERRHEANADIMEELISNAEQLHFLGFGFNMENIKQLNLKTCPYIPFLSGTCRTILKAERNRIQYHFWHNLEKRLILDSNMENCLEYVKEVVEFAPVSDVAHFLSNDLREIIVKSIHNLNAIFADSDPFETANINNLKTGDEVYFNNNDGERFTYLGKFEPQE